MLPLITITSKLQQYSFTKLAHNDIPHLTKINDINTMLIHSLELPSCFWATLVNLHNKVLTNGSHTGPHGHPNINVKHRS